jgi:hypothetical protein
VERLLVYIVPLAFLMHGLGMIGGVYFAGIALWAGAVPPGTYVGAGMSLAVIVALLMGW